MERIRAKPLRSDGAPSLRNQTHNRAARRSRLVTYLTLAKIAFLEKTMKVNDTVSWQRTFTEDDIRLFNRISGDEGVHHVTPDEQGRLMVHGLLTATVPTKIGGDMNFIAREMKFQFHRPVFAGDTVRCEVIVVEFAP